MLFHMLVAGGTGSGKTNAILYMLDLLFSRKGENPPSLFLFDPAGDASIDLLCALPHSDWNRVVILDPQYVAFGFNLLSLPEGLEAAEKTEVLQTQVEEFSILLSDVFNTDAANAPRLMWIFKGALYYLYTFTDDPTFWDLYNIMLLFTKRGRGEIEDLLRRRVKEIEIIQRTMEAISMLPQDAYMPVINRISNFVLPPSSITFRTFCARKSTIDLEKFMEPGRLTIFRIPSSLPNEFRRLFASAVVMKLYFASLKRARRLEREGLQPTARTPLILAADEFRDISEMRILRTVLAQSRKFGLYLWMVVQTLSEVPEDLMDSVQANVGPILAFRGSPDDGKKLAKLLNPQRADTVETLIPGLEDYAALVRKRLVGGRPAEPPFRVTFPKLRDPVHDYGEVLNYMKGDMEKAYGGSIGDRNLVYVDDEERARKERGDCPLESPLYWVPLAYLHRKRGPVPFSRMAEDLDDMCGWESNVVRVALSRLADSGRVEQRFEVGLVRSRKDSETKEVVLREPETHDEKLRARQAYYMITQSAEREFFEFYNKSVISDRTGGDLHVRLMKAVLEEYWERGYWCAIDRGDHSGEFPDILVVEPLITYTKGKEGKKTARMSTDDWKEDRRMPVEVETTPSKNPNQLRRNYEKDIAKYERVRFVVASQDQISEIERILEDKDLSKTEFVCKDVGLHPDEALRPSSRLENTTAEMSGGKAAVGQTAEEKKVEQKTEPTLQKNELRLLAIVLSSGYTNKAALASDLGVTGRQVTRYLVHLEDLGMLARKGRGYWLMQEGRIRAGSLDAWPEAGEKADASQSKLA
jgi:DNA helicase HerA-like ATPase